MTAAAPEIRSLPPERALALDFPERMTARGAKLREALAASRETNLTLARGNRDSLARTYRARLARAQADGVPTVGIQDFLAELASCSSEHLWGFTVRDSGMVYLGFTDEEISRLIAVVIIARHAEESLLLSSSSAPA
jgi:hypothetical protein